MIAMSNLLLKGLRNPRNIAPYIKGRILDLYYDYDSQQTNIYEKEWDVLLVLDGCRVDTLDEVSDDYGFLPESIQQITSVGGGSPDWLANTFTEEWIDEIKQTGYISANPHTRRVLDDSTDGLYADRGGSKDRLSDFDHFIPVWETDWDDELGTVPARAVTDCLIDYYRLQSSRRVIAHYMQPHFPSIPEPVGDGMDLNNEARWNSDDAWTLLKEGKITVEDAYSSYIENLRYVLNDIELVLSNLDAETVVITADHGNAFGEWREYSHGQPYLGSVRKVPWVEVAAEDTHNYTPDINLTKESNKQTRSVEEKLRALGYKT